jgi:tRNA pseudouridine38-40 synthase
LRYFLEIAYKGTNYHGWQVQKNAHSVQQELNSCLERLFQQPVETIASGRTDTGVHAEQQFVHLDLNEELNADLLFKINCILPNDIVVKNYFRVKDNAHARFDTISRSYEYRICRVKNPFSLGLAWNLTRDLDFESMKEATTILFEFEDFQSFSKVHTDVEHFLCKIIYAGWEHEGDYLIFKIEANRFLRGMVRTIVGTLIDIGKGKISVRNFREVLEKKDRKAAGAIVPAEGLYLTRIKYPQEIFLE